MCTRMEAYETFEHHGLTIKIYHDEDAQGPNEFEDDNGVLIVTTRNRYFDVTPKDWSADELDAIFKASNTKKRMYAHNGERYHVRPLFAYVHSAVALSLGRNGQFSDPWDSGCIGAVLIKTGIVGHGRKHGVDACARGHVESWNQYLSGDVWFYQVLNQNGDIVDSCGGFYGLDYCKEEARTIAESHK